MFSLHNFARLTNLMIRTFVTGHFTAALIIALFPCLYTTAGFADTVAVAVLLNIKQISITQKTQ